MRLAAARLVAVLATIGVLTSPVLAQDSPDGSSPAEAEGPRIPSPEGLGKPVLRLRIEDVGRLALRNSPRFKVLRLNPSIARTFEDEALGEFDPLFAARFTGGRDRSEVFFDPSRLGPGGSQDRQFLTEDRLSGGADVSAVEEWGGVWTLGYDVTSASRSGAASIQSLQPRHEGVLSLGYSHPLLRGAGREVNLSRVREAASRTSESEGRLRRDAERTVLEAETLYWALVNAIADREVIQNSITAADELLQIANARLEVGRGIEADVVEAKAGLARREGEEIAIERDIRNFSDRLRELVLPFDRPDADLEMTIYPVGLPVQDITDVPEIPDRAALETALGNRPDMQAAASALGATRLAEMRARNAHEYELNALVDGGLRGLGSGFSDSADQWEDRDSYVWTAGLELAIPIGNITASARLLRAERETLKAERDVSALRNAIVREVREAVRNMRSAAQRIEAAIREREATEAQFEAVQARLDKGKATPYLLLEVEEDRSRAVARVTAARVDLEIARAELASATGTLLEVRNIQELAIGE